VKSQPGIAHDYCEEAGCLVSPCSDEHTLSPPASETHRARPLGRVEARQSTAAEGSIAAELLSGPKYSRIRSRAPRGRTEPDIPSHQGKTTIGAIGVS
jgi:hypothetical protein